MGWNDFLTANAKQLPVVGLMGVIITVLWSAWKAERRENKRLNQEMKSFLMQLVRPDDDSSE